MSIPIPVKAGPPLFSEVPLSALARALATDASLAVISKAQFEEHYSDSRPGDVLPIGRYNSNNRRWQRSAARATVPRDGAPAARALVDRRGAGIAGRERWSVDRSDPRIAAALTTMLLKPPFTSLGSRGSSSTTRDCERSW
jgi:hypothetical protein